MTERPITMREFADAGYCPAGQRKMARMVGIDWRDFVRNGLSVERAKSIPGLAASVADVMRRREERG